MKVFFTEEQCGYAIGYTDAFVVDKFVKVTAVKQSYKALSWVATKTKIPTPAPQVLFERTVDAISNAF